jgi:hypothetical protein
MSQNSKVYINSPFGIAQHPWLTKADTAFDADGVFKVGLVLGGEDAQSFKALVDKEAQAAMDRYFQEGDGSKLPAKERKAWQLYAPLKVDTDEDDNPTGFIEFRFKQRAKLKLKDGTVKLVKIAVLDASGSKDLRKPVFGGSELRVRFTFRDVVMKTTKQVGVQLSFVGVQVRKLAEMERTSGFDAVEGYTETDQQPEGPASDDTSGGDY